MTEKKNDSGFSITPGQLLCAAREARSLSQTDVAKYTRLSVNAIDAIECDEYAQFGAPIFVRGYLSSYAKCVNIPEKQVLDALDASGLLTIEAPALLPKVEVPAMNVMYSHQRKWRFDKRWIVSGLSGLVVVILAVIWMNASDDTLNKQTVAANALKSAETIALTEPKSSDDSAAPSVAISEPVIVASKASSKTDASTSDSTTASSTTASTPSVASTTSQASVKTAAASTKKAQKTEKKVAKKETKDELRFVVKPDVAMHTTYTVKPAT